MDSSGHLSFYIPFYLRQNFELEFKKLTATGMSAKMASDINEKIDQTHNKSHYHDEPILSTEDDNDEARVDTRYEVKFRGEIPKSIVGLELDEYEGRDAYGNAEPWERVIEGLARRAAEKGELSTRALHNLAKAERRSNEPAMTESALSARKKIKA